jgi:protein SCO1/2
MGTEPALEIAGIYLPEPRRIEDFKLTHQTGEPFTRENLKGHWTFVFFGYTYCPDVCPMALADMNMVAERLTEQGDGQDTAFMLISVDPERDTPERLTEYTAYFNEQFTGATGTPDELTRLTQQVGAVYFIPDHEPGDNYVVDHSATITLFDPDGRLHALFTPPQNPDTMVADFIAIRERYQATL